MPKRSIEFYKQKISNIYNDRYELIDTTTEIQPKVPVWFYSKTCGHKFQRRIADFCVSNKDKNMCTVCAKHTRRTSSDDFIQDCTIASPTLEILTTDIHTVRDRVLTRCTICGAEKERLVRKLLEGTSCTCTPSTKQEAYYTKKRKNNEDFLQDLSTTVHDTLIPLEPYVSAHTPIKFKCTLCGRIFKAEPNNITSKTGMRCICQSRKSTGEAEVYEYIQSVYQGDIIRNYILPNKQEVDIYLPDLHIAFEYDGIYWHNEQMLYKRLSQDGKKSILLSTVRNYHLHKTELCKSMGIQLIHIFETEWIQQRRIIENKLLYLMKVSPYKRIYANHKTFVQVITLSRANTFLKKHHIQGVDHSASICLGLYRKTAEHKKELLSVMTFCKPRRALGQTNKTSYDYELSRFASNISYVVLHAYDKLFAYFEKNYTWKKLITYADRRWSTGKIYNDTAWKLIHTSKPNYFYVYKGSLKHRYTFSKQKLAKYATNPHSTYYDIFNSIYKDTLSEKDIMSLAKIPKIYDCGNYVYEYTR